MSEEIGKELKRQMKNEPGLKEYNKSFLYV
jgi:hypothetical protein